MGVGSPWLRGEGPTFLKKTKRLNKEERKVQDHQGTQVHM
jgi:hypothetical protein